MSLENFADLDAATKYVDDVGHKEARQALTTLDGKPNKNGIGGITTSARNFLETAIKNAKKADDRKAATAIDRAIDAAERSAIASEQANEIAEKALDLAKRSGTVAIVASIAAAISAGAALYPIFKTSEPIIARSEPVIIHVPIQQAPLPTAAPKSDSRKKEVTHRNAQARSPD